MKLIVEENVRLQLEHLREYPFVRTAMRQGRLSIHGWIYDMESGEIKILSTEQSEEGGSASPRAAEYCPLP